MISILMQNPFKKLHRAAFSGTAICPFCYHTKVTLLENIGPYIRRYECKKCHNAYREDLSPEGHYGKHPGIADIARPYNSRKTLKPEWRVGVHKFKR